MIVLTDQEQKNIIDKLANFVARNGSKFEEMTKEKQKGNPRFAFLFSGEYYNYYRWKVSFEIGKTDWKKNLVIVVFLDMIDRRGFFCAVFSIDK